MSNLVKKGQPLHHTTTCRKKRGVAYRVNTPWAPSGKTRIIHSEEKIVEIIVKQSKKLIGKVLSYIVTISDLSGVSKSEIFSGVWSYSGRLWQCIKMCGKKVPILYKRKSFEVNIGPYNNGILKLLKSNMNLQFITDVYAMLAYLT